MLSFVPLSHVRVQDAFLRDQQRLVRDVVLPYQWETLNDRVPDAEPSHCIHNLRVAAGQIQGRHEGPVFQDSDLYKWLEAVAYSLALQRDEKLEALADGAIELIEAAQEPDGYLDTYFSIEHPGRRFFNLMEGHELYCAGHLIEAAVAYYEATGKPRVLRVATRLSDCIDAAFGPDGLHGYPGHPEIELALIKLYRVTREERYLRLCQFFLDARGADEPKWFERECARPGHTYIWEDMRRFDATYFQADAPVREQRDANGHAVRAMYLYCAMADVARLAGDESLRAACERLYRSATERRMYVTGGIGSSAIGERFTSDYDLPGDAAYAESCASIGLMLLSNRMFLLTGDDGYYNVWERALRNTVMGGMGRDGRHFFYVNPLSVEPGTVKGNPTLTHVKTTRQTWFGVACCPPNIARLLLSLGGQLFAMEAGRLHILSHIDAAFSYEGVSLELSSDSDERTLRVDAPPMEIILREPDGYALKGAARIAHASGQATYRYTLTPVTRVVRAHPYLSREAGKCCLMRGETVYCLEQADNGAHLAALWLDSDAPIEEARLDFLPPSLPALRARGYRALPTDALYSDAPPTFEEVELLLIPYSQWNNRGEGEMRVWINDARSGPRGA